MKQYPILTQDDVAKLYLKVEALEELVENLIDNVILFAGTHDDEESVDHYTTIIGNDLKSYKNKVVDL
jgi:hypothetical protein